MDLAIKSDMGSVCGSKVIARQPVLAVLTVLLRKGFPTGAWWVLYSSGKVQRSGSYLFVGSPVPAASSVVVGKRQGLR